MSHASSFFYGDYQGEVSSAGVGFENDNNHVEVGHVYPIISLKSSDKDRVVVFETDVQFDTFAPTTVEFVNENNEVLSSYSLERSFFNNKHVEVNLPANNEKDKSTIGVRFTEETLSQVSFKGKVFAYDKENHIETIVNIPAN